MTQSNAQIQFSEEQAMLAETAANFCRDKSPISQVRQSIDADANFDEKLWQEIVDLGWLGIAVAEDHGGLGLGLAEVAPIVEAMGRNLFASPYIATTLSIQALAGSGSESQCEKWLPKLATGTIGSVGLTEQDGDWRLDQIQASAKPNDGGYLLAGRKTFMLDALAADVLVISVLIDGAPRLVLVERSQLPDSAIVRHVVIDETRRVYEVVIDGVQIATDAVLPRADLEGLERAALLLLSAEAAGGLVGVLHCIVEYLNTRKQFDQFIGSYQALKHPTVDILLSAEAAKSYLYYAATALAGSDEVEAEKAVRMAKAQSSEAFAFAGDRAVQFHGGFGFTYECDAQLFLRRALWCQYQFGDERHQRQLLAPLLLN